MGPAQLPTNHTVLTAATSWQLDPLPAAISICGRLNSRSHTARYGDKLTQPACTAGRSEHG